MTHRFAVTFDFSVCRALAGAARPESTTRADEPQAAVGDRPAGGFALGRGLGPDVERALEDGPLPPPERPARGLPMPRSREISLTPSR